jgi:carbamoyltransferase
MIVDGQIIGLSRGKSECGPRALGHRSIVCRPDLSDIQDRLNLLKKREWYRPFAPIVLDQFAGEILDAAAAHSPYMSMAYDIAEAWHGPLEGVRHVDDSTRPQILTRENAPFLYAVIEQVYAKTEIPAILNTSFNNQEPIVETPGDAFATFLATGMDALVLEDYAIISNAPR